MALLMLEMLPLTRGTFVKKLFFPHKIIEIHIRIASLNFGEEGPGNRDWTQRGCSFHPLFQCQDGDPTGLTLSGPSGLSAPYNLVFLIPVNSISVHSSKEPES